MILGKNINELSKEVFQKVKTGQLKINIIHLIKTIVKLIERKYNLIVLSNKLLSLEHLYSIL